MFRTDLTKIGAIPVLVWLLISTCFGSTLMADSNPNYSTLATLACNDNVNVSVGTTNGAGECCAEITIEMVLEGENAIPGYDPANFFITVDGVDGAPGSTVELCGLGNFEVVITEIDPITQETVNSCWGNLTLEDKLAPTIVDDPATVTTDTGGSMDNTSANEACPCPVGNTDPNCEFAAACLSDVVDYPVPMAVDNCDGEVLTSFLEEVVSAGGDCEETVIQRTYIFSDGFNNKVTSCVNEYRLLPINIVSDIVAPLSQVYLPCGSSTDPADVYAYFYDEYLGANTDEDSTPAEIEAAMVEANAFGNLNAYPTIEGKPLLNNSSLCNTATTVTDLVLYPCAEECNNMAKVIREWTVHDWCNATSVTYSQKVVTADDEGPSITVNSTNELTYSVDPWGCFGIFDFPAPEHLFDDCSSKVSYTVTGPAGVDISFDPDRGYHVDNAPKGTHIFTYNGVDCCGNITAVDVTVYIVDNTPPVAIAKQDIVLSLTTNANGEGIAKLFTNNIDNGSYDGCSPVYLEIRREEDYCDITDNLTYNDDGHAFDNTNDTDEGQSVRFCCNDISAAGVDADGDGIVDYSQIKVWLRVWDDGDMDGVYGTDGDNFNETWAYVRLEDKLTPSIQCPSDIVIGCEEDYLDLDLTGSATAVASCDALNVDYKDFEKVIDGCGAGYVRRQWFVVNSPSIFCIQRIDITGSEADDISVSFPEDLTVDCADDFGDTGIPSWSAGPCDQMAYSLDVDTFKISDGACYKVLKKWTVINWCNYDPELTPFDADFGSGIWTQTQIIKVLDETAPEFLSCEDVMFETDDFDDLDNDGVICENNAVMLTNIASDEGSCPSSQLEWVVQIDLNGDWTIDYEFSSYLGTDDPFYVAPTTSGNPVKVTIPESVEGSMNNHRVLWKVTDGCGNFRACTNYFMVVDKKAPTPYCTNLSTAFMQNGMVAIWACDFDLGSFDNCSDQEDLRFTFSDTHPDLDPNYIPSLNCASMTFECDDIPADGSAVPVEMYVWDEKDNFSYCTVFLNILDNGGNCDDNNDGGASKGSIAGRIATPEGEMLADVQVELMSAAPEFPLTHMTDGAGEFTFSDLDMHNDYLINGSKIDDYKNGVSTVDIILIQRHLLGIQQLGTVHQLIAADANADERVTASDMVDIRKLILDVNSVFPKSDSWVFLDKSTQLLYGNPWPLDNVVGVSDLSVDMMTEDFVAIKIGDVNSSVVVNATGNDTEVRGNETLTLSYDDVTVEAGNTVEVALRATAEEFFGAQIAFNHPGFTVVEITSDVLDVSSDHFAPISQSATALSVNSVEAIDLDGDALITVTLKADNTSTLSEALYISSEAFSSEAYTGQDLSVNAIQLQSNQGGYALMQNTPNPFSGETTITFALPQDGEATLTVFDITGKVAYSSTQTYTTGIHAVTLNSDDLGAAGVWFYRLNSGDYSATKKLTVIK